MRPTAVIFDLDGVITDTARYHFLAWQRLASEIGIQIDSTFNERLKGVSRLGSLELILKHGGKSCGEEEKHRLAERKNRYYQELIGGLCEKDLCPGAAQVLEELKSAGVKIGLASASRNAAFIVERLGIPRAFDYIADPSQITHSKPAPDIFLAVAEALNVSPAVCVGVEDSMAGLLAIKAAGMLAVGVGDPQILQKADLVIPHISGFSLQVLRQAH